MNSLSPTLKHFCLIALLALCLGATVGATDADLLERMETRTTADGRRSPTQCVVTISNPGGLCKFPNYKSGSFEQKVSKTSPKKVTITVKVPESLPTMTQAYPIEKTPKKVRPFLKPTARVQSDAPEIEKTAKEILEAAKPATEQELVRAVCAWVRENVPYSSAFPTELTDASKALERRAAHAVGYTHLTAALLRNLGVPTRIVRTFRVLDKDGASLRFSRQSLIEVYYPKDKKWMLLSPQIDVPVSPLNIYLYAAADWDQEKHDAFKPTSVDPETKIEIEKIQ